MATSTLQRQAGLTGGASDKIAPFTRAFGRASDMCYHCAMSGNGKILTGLIERRALELAFQELSGIGDAETQEARAQQIAEQGDAALTVLLSFLDTSDPQFRAGLGQVALHLDRTHVVMALRTVARTRDRSDQARLTALTILDRFLREPVDDGLLNGLHDPSAVARQSLREYSHEMERSPFAAVDYWNQLAEQPPDVARLILDTIATAAPDPHLITLLRLFAQGEPRALAQAALEQLSRVRLPEAAAALLSLSLTLPPGLAVLAERGLRKLNLSGVFPTAAPEMLWRALLSPIDGVGAQVIWFVSPPDLNGQVTLFSLLAADSLGITASFGSTEIREEGLPPMERHGETFRVPQSGGGSPITLIEVSFDAGRLTVQEALRWNWASNRPTPLEYRLLNPLLWCYGPPTPLAAPPAGQYTPTQAAALLDHPAFNTWYWQSAELFVAAGELGQRPSAVARAERISALASAAFEREVVESYQRRLSGMARWLMFAGQPDVASLAQAATEQLDTLPPAELPFVRRLIGIGLDAACAGPLGSLEVRTDGQDPVIEG